MNTFNNDSPLYLQLRRHIEARIISKALKEEEALPSLRVLAQDYNLNPITVGNALSALIDAGILFKKRGVGIFVASGAREQLIAAKGKDFVTEQLKPVIKLAKQLELPKETLISTIETIYGGTNE